MFLFIKKIGQFPKSSAGKRKERTRKEKKRREEHKER
jgi:hypothetical protein